MQGLTRSDVVQVLGELDETMITEVIATGADQSELEVAVARLRDDTIANRSGHA
ncbi:MAG TPA: hypothetical protein VK427_07195 [Kofleriaceae bacterium]|nr:hypothetical protein [Kofleriaceae bacterium]